MSLKVNIKKRLGNFNLDVAFETERGVFAILGASGCGKSMTLKCIAGIETPDEGRIELNGRVLYDSAKKINLTPQKRRVGYMFQDYALFPNMTVEENISVVPKIMKWDKERTKKRVRELMDIVNMPYEEYGKKYPKQLSGGQQQRIGVLRALAVNPPIILMDEPFGALDPITREILQSEVKKIQTELNISVLFITHDMHEAMKMADRVIFMDRGRILQEAAPKEMVLHPANEEIRKFISLQEVTLSGDQLTA